MPLWNRLLWAVFVLCALAFRLAIVASWHAPAGDGHQYYHLSQELVSDGRFAYGPSHVGLAWSRLPGYPLFLAFIAVRKAHLPLEAHLVRATQSNALLDVSSALLVVALLRRRAARPLTLGLASILVIICPPLIFLSCYGLTESFATFLFVLELQLGVCILDDKRPALYACLAGVVAGVGQLTRVDAVTAAPGVLVAIFYCPLAWKRRFALLGLFVLASTVVFAPWPLRNIRRFGAPHFEGTEWLSQAGEPLRSGLMKWMRSWSGGEPGGAYTLFRIANGASIDPENRGVLLPQMYDDEAERAQLAEIFHRYDREGLSAKVDGEFIALADERARKHPWRQNVVLPAKRLVALWTPLPEYELPMRSGFLSLPRLRTDYDYVLKLMLLAALVGAFTLWRRDRALAIILLLPIVFRSVLHSCFAHPCPTQRYVVELMPSLMMLAAECLAALAFWLAALRSQSLLRQEDCSIENI